MDMIEKPPIATEQDALASWQLAFTPEIQKLNAEYPYWDKVKYLRTANNIEPKNLWFAIKLLRQANRNLVKLGRYTFNFTVTDEMFELLHYFDMNIGGNLTGEQIIPSENKNAYLISSIMEEAIASSRMEGAATTRKVAKDMLRKQEKPKNKGQQMIMNNYLTITMIKEHSKEKFSLERLLKIHRTMTAETLDNENDAGKLRTNDNILVMDGITGDIAHIPPSHTELETLLHDLEIFFNKNSETFIHPIVKAIIVHFMLSYFHPFVDGNGRTARSLFYWYMIKQGYWLVEYMSISRTICKTKKQYENAFLHTEFDDNDLTYFVLYHLRKMKVAFEDLKQYLKRKQQENSSVAILANIKGVNMRQAQILQILKEKPDTLFTVKDVENRFSVGNQTARTDLYGLVKLNYLSEIKLNKRKFAFVKLEKFEENINSFS
jgi:Fic family protein